MTSLAALGTLDRGRPASGGSGAATPDYEDWWVPMAWSLLRAGEWTRLQHHIVSGADRVSPWEPRRIRRGSNPEPTAPRRALTD